MSPCCNSPELPAAWRCHVKSGRVSGALRRVMARERKRPGSGAPSHNTKGVTVARNRVRVDGLNNALRAVGRIPGAMRQARTETLHEWADAVEAGAEERVPHRTGYLKSKIEQRVSGGTAEVGVSDQQALAYAEHVEQGTSSMRDRPYLRPAFDAARPQVTRTYRAAFARHVRGE